MSARDIEGLADLAEALADLERSVSRVVVPAGVLSFLEAGFDFDVPPAQAIAYFRRKGLEPTFSYADMIGDAHDRAFTVAKMMDVDLLGQVRASLDSALANGTSFQDWKRDLMPSLKRAGWWGAKEVIDPATGKVMQTQLGSPWRLETIFRTNMQAAYAQGHWEEIESQSDIAPYVMYDAIDDLRTRPSHKARDGTILPWNHPWWQRNCPPLGYSCRCGVIQLSEDDLAGMGLKVSQQPPEMPDREWRNPRTGEWSSWPDGVDPGFGRQPRIGQLDPNVRLLDERIGVIYDANARQAAEQSIATSARASAVAKSVAVATGEIRAGAAAQAVVVESRRRARTEEAQVAAQIQLEQMAAADGAAKTALEELSLDPAWRALPATERLRDVKRRTREIARRG